MRKSFIVSVDLNIDNDILNYVNLLFEKRKTLENYYELNIEEYEFIYSQLDRMNLQILKIDGLPMNHIIIYQI